MLRFAHFPILSWRVRRRRSVKANALGSLTAGPGNWTGGRRRLSWLAADFSELIGPELFEIDCGGGLDIELGKAELAVANQVTLGNASGVAFP